jgi:HEAT repeat protein
MVAAFTGCGQDKQPIMSHGKPVGYWIDGLKDRDPIKRQKAVKALGHVGAADPAAIPAVIEALNDPQARVRAEAALALLNLGPAAKDAVPGLDKAQHDHDETVRLYARKALERIRGT